MFWNMFRFWNTFWNMPNCDHLRCYRSHRGARGRRRWGGTAAAQPRRQASTIAAWQIRLQKQWRPAMQTAALPEHVEQ
jgi:hypothetical protein